MGYKGVLRLVDGYERSGAPSRARTLRCIRSRGMVFFRVLEFAVAYAPVLCQDLIEGGRSLRIPPAAGCSLST